MLRYGFFDSEIEGYDEEGMPIFDRAESSDFLSSFLSQIISDGVLGVPSNSFQVIADGTMNVTVMPGFGIAKGRFAMDENPTALAVEKAPTTYRRIDRVVLRNNYPKRRCEILVKTGTPAATPSAPDLLRPAAGDYWELSLATIAINSNQTIISQSNITDTRADPTQCGIVTQLIDHLDTSVFSAQLNAFFEEYRKKANADLADGIRRRDADIESFQSTFTTWFNNVKGQLSTDQAGHLQTQLDALKEKHDKDIDSVTKKLITLTVTTDNNELIGDSIKVTKGVTTLEQAFDASKSLAFHLPELGTWKVTNTNPDHGRSSEVTCEMYGRYSVAIEGVFSWKNLVKAGGLSTDGYASLADVLADERAVRQLMTKHASADILADEMIKNRAGVRAKIASSKNAMKWIGLRDYICDKLLADAETQSDLLASDHWRYILKDGVPCMTSATSPYGEVTGPPNLTVYSSYKIFGKPIAKDTNDCWVATPGNEQVNYHFKSPICIKKFSIINHFPIHTPNRCLKEFSIVASNNGTQWTEISKFRGENYTDSEIHIDSYDLYNDGFYTYYGIKGLSTYDTQGNYGLGRLYFYGRSLNVSVPAMTSDTAPWGKIIYSSQWDGGSSAGRQAFSGTDLPWYPSPGDSSGKAYIGYVYPTPTRVRQVTFICHNGNQPETCVVERSDDGERWEKASKEIRITVDNETKTLNVDASPARYWRIRNVSGNIYIANQGGFNLRKVQFYGNDYSERDDRTYLYDHGVEVLPITTTGAKNPDVITLSAVSGAKVNTDVTSAKRLRASVGANASGSVRLACGSAFKAITSADMPVSAYLDISSVTGSADVGVDMTAAGTFDIAEMWLE